MKSKTYEENERAARLRAKKQSQTDREAAALANRTKYEDTMLKGKFVCCLVKLAKVSSRYLERTNSLLDLYDALFENGLVEENYCSEDGNVSIDACNSTDRTFFMIHSLSMSMFKDDDHFFYLIHDSEDNPFECDLSKDPDIMKEYTNEYGWNNMSSEDKKQFVGWANDDCKVVATEFETVLNALETKFNAIADRYLEEEGY